MDMDMDTDTTKPLLRDLPRPTLVAHRGGSGLAPENTLVAFETAVGRFGAHQLELDVRLSRDGVPVVVHDETLDRTTDATGPVSSRTLAELRALDAGHRFSSDGGVTHPHRGAGVRIPTLDEVLAALPVPIMMELKDPTPACRAAVLGVLRARGATERVCVGAVDEAPALAIARELPEACRFYPEAAAARFLAGALGGGPMPPPAPFDVLAVPLAALADDRALAALLAAAHARGHHVQVWTVDDPDDMRRCLRLGVDGIITDRPDVLAGVLGERLDQSRA